MNNDRRSRIEKVREIVNRTRVELEQLRDGEADNLHTEEREAFESLAEGFQQSERGQASEAAADALESAYDAIDYAVTSLEEAYESYEEAAQ